MSDGYLHLREHQVPIETLIVGHHFVWRGSVYETTAIVDDMDLRLCLRADGRGNLKLRQDQFVQPCSYVKGADSIPEGPVRPLTSAEYAVVGPSAKIDTSPGAVNFMSASPKKKGATRFSEGKVPLEFLADFPNAMDALAKVCEGGTIDHKRDNWRKGRPIRATFGSLFRHAFKAYNGEDFDTDFLEKHNLEILNLAQVMWNAAVMIEWLADPDLDVDDRSKKGVDPKLMANGN